MKRELKFRAWCITTNQMLNSVGFHPNIIQKHDDYKDGEDGQYTISPEFDNYKLMQFTGLKDKNGVDIYEGDIVNQFDLNVRRPVIYINGSFGYYDSDSKFKEFVSFAQNHWYEWNNGQSNHIEIIGNIYQHPTLLTPKS